MRLTLVNLIKNTAWNHFKGAVKDISQAWLWLRWLVTIYSSFNLTSQPRKSDLVLRISPVINCLLLCCGKFA